ncbi:MAG: N-acetyltransferase [Methanomicrobiales archaeon HGW-Methanomicrobiales-4]|nr:MAG: N-acetyltransferase [Methanomicrobiales archaeon HGW-Methanomicrobiales-4]
MHHEPIEFKIVREWDCGEIVDLYRSAGWWEEYYDPNGIQLLISGSFIFMLGISTRTGKAVAMGRILSDRIKIGYIQDLCVLSELRGMRIGTNLLGALIQAGQSAGLSSLHLVAEPGTISFYEKSGFISEKGLIFLTKTPGGLHET